MGLNRTEGDPYAPVRVSSSVTLDPANDAYGVTATLGTPVTVTTPPAFAHRAGGPFSSVGDRWKVFDLGLNASTQPITVAAGAGMTFVGGAPSIQLTVSGSSVQLTVLDDGATIQVDSLSGTVSPGTSFPAPAATVAHASSPVQLANSPITVNPYDTSAGGVEFLTPLDPENGWVFVLKPAVASATSATLLAQNAGESVENPANSGNFVSSPTLANLPGQGPAMAWIYRAADKKWIGLWGV